MQADMRASSSRGASCSPRCPATPVPVSRRRPVCRPRAPLSFIRCSAAAAVEAEAQEPADSPSQTAAAQPKYQRIACTSPCPPNDTRCHQVEAVFQHVLNYPRIPTRVCQWLPTIEQDVHTITHTVEGLSRRFGQELTLVFLRRAPHILQHDLDTLLSRAEHIRVMLDLKPSDLNMILRKNPVALVKDVQTIRLRYNALHTVLPLTHEGVRTLARKFPLILNFQTKTIEELVDVLRQLSYTRIHWQEDFDTLTPGLLAYFFRDSNDILRRLEFLVTSGTGPFVRLRDVFKMTDNLFNRKYRGFAGWKEERRLLEQRRQLMHQRRMAQQQAAVAQQQQQQAAAAAAAARRGGEGFGGQTGGGAAQGKGSRRQ